MVYYQRIDGLRFVAIFFVLVEHFAPLIGGNISAGYFGVDLFFVISGFLITSMLLKPDETSFGKAYLYFLTRRILRIFPLYYFAIFGLWLLDFQNVREHFNWLITFTYNYAWVYFSVGDTHINHFWSLCVEEQYYIIWPIFVLVFRNKPTVLLGFLVFFVFVGYAQFIYSIFPFMEQYNNISLFTKMAPLAIGSLGALCTVNFKWPEFIYRNRLIEILILLALFLTMLCTFHLKPVVLSVFSLFLVLKASIFGFLNQEIDNFLKNNWTRYLGLISYGIYVFHYPIGYFVSVYIIDPLWNQIEFESMGPIRLLRHHSWVVKFPISSILSICLAAVSYAYLEKPIKDIKTKYFRRSGI